MDQISQFIKNLGTGRIVMVALVGFVFVALIGVLMSSSQGGPMDVLYSGLEQQDAAEIVANLDQQGVPYQLEAGGSIIRVPSSDVSRLRLQLAGEGLGGGVIGKEIFDRDSSFGRTTFELNVNLVRAIEGELSRTIRELQSISEARVHIVMPERRPFQREASEPKASILVRTRAGGLSSDQARAIQALVASAVPGLSSERVAISDTTGRLLSDGRPEADQGSSGSLQQARLSTESLYRTRIENLLASRVGRGAVRAEVAVTMNRSRTTTSQVEYDPDTQVILSSSTVEESARENEAGASTVTVANNIPNGGAGQTGAGDSSVENKTEEHTNFENSKTETVTVTEPGEVMLIRASVLVDGIRTLDEDGNTTAYEERTDAELQQLQALVESAIPYDQNRGDSVTVQSMRFADPEPIGAAPVEFNLLGLNYSRLIDLVRNGGLFMVLVLFLLIVVRPIVQRVVEAIPDAPPPPEPGQIEAGGADMAPALAGPVQIDSNVIAAAAAGDEAAQDLVLQSKSSGELDIANLKTDSRIDMAQVEGRLQDSVLKKVSEIVKSNPEDSAAIIRSWMYAES